MSKKRSARDGRKRSLAISGWPLRFKVALAIAIPLLLAAALGGLQVRSDLDGAANSSSSAKQVEVLRPTVAYLTAAERAMVAAQDTSDASAADLDAAIQDVQDASNELTATADTAELTTEQRYQVDALLDLSRAIREAGTDTLSPGTWIAQLRQLQSGVTQLVTSIVNAQIDPEPRLELLAQTLAGRNSLAMQQALAATERTGPTGSLELFAELGVEGAAIDRLASGLGDSEAATIAALRTENAQRSRTIRTGGDDLGGDAAYTQYDALIENLMDGIDQQLADSASDARRSALVSGGILLGALLATILLAFLVSRLLLNPIRKVREGARTVAHEQLPEAVARIRAGDDPGPITPIDVTTHEEVGQVARAVDELHRQAVSLASGEAKLRSQVSDMFITLSRRNTSLINQQLGLIETLEKDEEDPRRLKSLFRLDHLAARMRRTADSLLVLADVPTHTSADELTVASSLEAATAGVQDYQRVRVGPASTARISDDAGADVVHLLTELVDNALEYSAPTTTVFVSATTTVNGVAVEIDDAGLGIPTEALADLNEILRSGGDVTPDTARRMGLFVVSRLAQRHGIKVSLQRNDHNGTTAAVLLPTSILDAAADHATAPAHVVAPAAHSPERTAAAKSGPSSAEHRLDTITGLPQRQRPVQAPPAAAAALDQQAVGEAAVLQPDDSQGEDDTPIFKALQSAWLNADATGEDWRTSEVEEGWAEADRVAASLTEAPVNAAGLPTRRPGARVVPGGVAKPPTAGARDPEAIRARLSAHVAGVSRGRANAGNAPDQLPSEESPA